MIIKECKIEKNIIRISCNNKFFNQMDNIYQELHNFIKNVETKFGIRNIKIGESDISISDYCINITGIIKKTRQNAEQIMVQLNECLTPDFKVMFDTFLTSTNSSYFYNLRFSHTYINLFLERDIKDSKNIFDVPKDDKTILIDYASPNVAKDMHVGHMRSTFIGDVLANVFEYLGKNVIRVNHIGDFGLQFGMIINYILTNKMNIDEISADGLQSIYTSAKKMFDGDECIEITDDHLPMDSSNEFKKMSYHIIKDIHTNVDSPYIPLWEKIRNLSLGSYESIFNRLDIHQIVMGESFYKRFIPELLSEIHLKGISETKDGRITVGIDKSVPILTVVKSDGAYTYATTDLAAIKYRVNEQKADSIYYVVDTGQSSHFKQLFSVSKAMGYLDKTVAEHLNFGVVLGDDGLRIRSKNGDTPRLVHLLDECIEVTHKTFDERKKIISDEDCESIAVSSLRYANISICRTSDFIFSPVKMLSFKGDTYMYLLYAYVRCKQIIAKYIDCLHDEIEIKRGLEEGDYKLMYTILKFPCVIIEVFDTKMPHILATYTYKLVNAIQVHYNIRTLEFDKDNKMISVNVDRLQIVKICEKLLTDIFKIIGLKLMSFV